eukprot:5062562-Pyramimonas_sp.AAC.1
MGAVENGNGAFFFLDAVGGCGKTFMLNLLLRAVRAHDGIAIATASSGLAALLLDGGSTAHSRFKIPLDLNEHSRFKI